MQTAYANHPVINKLVQLTKKEKKMNDVQNIPNTEVAVPVVAVEALVPLAVDADGAVIFVQSDADVGGEEVKEVTEGEAAPTLH